ncbi:MAG: acetyl-CoA carboxylase biotin carboxyl carrier protein [Deltaproteobacteria bacterium]|nr:acetyl-CoA carboxylase biotin carboxyl carrier protein [Deltaproteobacteria bacterium]
MDLKEIRALYRFLSSTDIIEFELEDPHGKIRIRRGEAVKEKPLPDAAIPKPARPEGKEEAKEEKESRIKTITSPMVGTFYRAASPDSPPFVDVESEVKHGQVVCIIEAMKIMNEVESEYAGRVIAILVENGHPIEYGEPLFQIEV